MKATTTLVSAAVTLLLGLLLVQSCARSAPAVTLPSATGESVSLADHRGSKAVVLVFFASWCAACAEQVEPIKAFVAETDPARVAVYGVSIQETAETIATYVAKKELTYPVLLDSDGSAAARYEVKGIPTIVAIDADGKVVYRGHAMPTAADLEPRLAHEL